MAAPATAHLVLTVLQRHITDSVTLQALLADLENVVDRPTVDRGTKDLFRLMAAQLREAHGQAAPPLSERGHWKNKGTRSWS